MAQVYSHVSYGLEILQESGTLNQDVIDMVAHHHERYDGSGYPDGLTQDDIPSFARIAAIVDTYDAITSNRSYAAAISPSEAIRLLYQGRDAEFQAELVEAFIQAVGIYPAGTLVELSSGEVGVVVAEYRSRRLRPRVMVLLDAEKNTLAESKMINLQDDAGSDSTSLLTIAKSLQPGAYGIDLADVGL
jgi:HD-GYP domain-containing protein (c-di-GMP phosphodiesterase class II)